MGSSHKYISFRVEILQPVILSLAMPALSPPAESKPKRVPVAADLSWRLVRSEGRPVEIVEFEESVVAFFLESAAILGVPKSVAALYGICFASPEPLSYSDIQARLNLSAGSISQGLKVLREVGALKLVRIDSRDCMTPDLELRKLVQHWLTERLQNQLTAGQSRLRVIAELVPSGRTPSGKALSSRIQSLQGWHEKAAAILPLVRTALKFR